MSNNKYQGANPIIRPEGIRRMDIFFCFRLLLNLIGKS